MNSRKFFKYWFPVILWVGFTFWMSTGGFAAANTAGIIEQLLRYVVPDISDTHVVLVHGAIRKLAHLTEYFVLGLLLYRAFSSDSADLKAWRWVFLSLLAVMLLAAGDEFHQSFVATRTASFIDVGIDALGGFLATCTIMLWKTVSAGLARNGVRVEARIGSDASRRDSRRDERSS
jgi:VanZ family protein